jgi:hypothetical protein
LPEVENVIHGFYVEYLEVSIALSWHSNVTNFLPNTHKSSLLGIHDPMYAMHVQLTMLQHHLSLASNGGPN